MFVTQSVRCSEHQHAVVSRSRGTVADTQLCASTVAPSQTCGTAEVPESDFCVSCQPNPHSSSATTGMISLFDANLARLVPLLAMSMVRKGVYVV